MNAFRSEGRKSSKQTVIIKTEKQLPLDLNMVELRS